MRTVIDSIIEWTFDLALYYYENNQHEKAVETIKDMTNYKKSDRQSLDDMIEKMIEE